VRRHFELQVHPLEQRFQLASDRTGRSIALAEGDVLAQQMRVAHLPQRHRPEARRD